MQLEAKILLEDLTNKYQELIPLLDKLKDYIAHNAANVGELADIAFVCREVDTATDEFLKRVRDIGRISQAVACVSLATNGDDIVRTETCTASPNPKPWYKIPYKRAQNPEQWDRIMEAIGVSELANKRDLVRIYAPAFMEYCGELIGSGNPPPAGVDPTQMTSMELNLRITRRK